MDNFHIDVTCEKKALTLALELGFQGAPGKTAKGYRIEPGDGKAKRPRLILYWYQDDRIQHFPSPLTAALVQPIIEAWLAVADYGPEPDHDGSNGHGWRVYNEDWGRIGGDTHSFLAIEPCWAWYGK